MISSVFIDRPRLAIVIAIVITLAGALAMTRIPVAQLPDIVPPQVTVSATYPGASAAVVESAVAQPIEAQVVGVDKMIYMKSDSGNDGSYTLTVSFDLSSNPDIDVVNVNNRVQTALSQLPPEVQLEGLTVQKRSTSILEFLAFYGDGPKQDPLFISNYVLINVLDQLSRTPGVGQANLFSKLNYSMRVWFDINRLTALSLTPGDIIAAIQQQNVVAPIGRIGARPIGNDQQFQFNLQTQGRLVTPGQFGTIVIRANPDGSVLRLRDVARVAARRAEHGQRDAAERPSRRADRHLSLARCERGGYGRGGGTHAGETAAALPGRTACPGDVRLHHVRQRYQDRGDAHSGHRLRRWWWGWCSCSSAACAPRSSPSSPFPSA